MTLVEAGNNYYINMDLLTEVWYSGKEYHASFCFVNNSDTIISESAYNTILKYGKAKI